MQVRQRVNGRNIVIDAVTLAVTADGRLLLEEHGKRIVDRAKETETNPLFKMIDILSKQKLEQKH